MKYLRLIIGIIIVVASLLKLFTLWGIVHITWLERVADESWTIYGVPIILIIVGTDLIYHGIKDTGR